MKLPDKIVVFDGVCNLCNASVQFILKRDPRKQFHFTSLQGDAGQEIASRFELGSMLSHSFVLIDNGKVYTHSSAALMILKYLGGLWKLGYGLMIVPKFIRDGIYTWIARNRYSWFGKQESCWLPGPKWQERFI